MIAKNEPQDPEEAINNLRIQINRQADEGQGRTPIIKELRAKGIDRKTATQLVEEIFEERRKYMPSRVKQTLGYGMMMCLIGAVIALVSTYNTTSWTIEAMLLAWSPIVCGLLLLLTGLNQIDVNE